jgi:predicted P-loop ATPase
LRHTYSLKRNIITRKIENNGKILDENDLNTMFLDAKVLHNELTSDLFLKVIFSNNTENYNPLLDWFENNTGEPQGVIDAFFGSFNTSDDICYLGKKWLVGVISAIHGVHSPLMLILAGEKQGTGKTEAFRRMLPSELRQYYAESKLDAGKDDEILMTQKLIIMDDEMGGKSKKESKRLKELTSKQTFTLREPYGKMNVDLNRLAVLCGTTNDMQILNDPTGNRRLIPIQIRSIDYKKYNEVDKRLLLIEAYNLWKSGFEWQLTSEDVEAMQQNNNKFEEFSLEYELINKYFRIPNESWLIEMSATEIKIMLELKSNQKISLKRIGMELKRMGFESEIKKVNGKTIQVYSVMETTQNTPRPDTNLPF